MAAITPSSFGRILLKSGIGGKNSAIAKAFTPLLAHPTAARNCRSPPRLWILLSP